MKQIKRYLAVCLLLILCLTTFAPALAARNATDLYGDSVVLVSYSGLDSAGASIKRSGTGVVVGSITDAKESSILFSPEIIGNLTGSVKVTVKLIGKTKATYENVECHILDESLAIASTAGFYEKVTALPLRSITNLTVNQEVQLAAHTGSTIYAYENGQYRGFESGLNMEQTLFNAKDISALASQQKRNAWYVYGAILFEKTEKYVGILGFGIRLVENVNSVYFRSADSVADVLNKNNIVYATIGDFPSATATNAPAVAPDNEPVKKMDDTEIVAQPAGLSTAAIIGIIGGAAVLIAAIVLIVVLNKRKQQPSGDAGKTVGVQPAASYKLVGVAGELAGREYPLTGKLVIGRDTKVCNIKFSASTPGVSGVHCRVVLSGGKVTLTDLNSSYGTLKSDGSKLTANESVTLNRGDSFYLGSKNNGFTLQ